MNLEALIIYRTNEDRIDSYIFSEINLEQLQSQIIEWGNKSFESYSIFYCFTENKKDADVRFIEVAQLLYEMLKLANNIDKNNNEYTMLYAHTLHYLFNAFGFGYLDEARFYWRCCKSMIRSHIKTNGWFSWR